MRLVLLLLFADAASNKVLLDAARAGDRNSQIEAVLLHRKGALPELASNQANLWFQQSLIAKHPAACLEQAKTLIETNIETKISLKKNPEEMLRCAALSRLPEAQYLLGRLILNRTAAEDEHQRFEGLAYLALSAKAGYAPGLRRWALLLADLTQEDLERVQQKVNDLVSGR